MIFDNVSVYFQRLFEFNNEFSHFSVRSVICPRETFPSKAPYEHVRNIEIDDKTTKITIRRLPLKSVSRNLHDSNFEFRKSATKKKLN